MYHTMDGLPSGTHSSLKNGFLPKKIIEASDIKVVALIIINNLKILKFIHWLQKAHHYFKHFYFTTANFKSARKIGDKIKDFIEVEESQIIMI